MGQVIYLDIDDEITSAVARIRTAAPGPVVLVVPFGSRLASSRINFRLLAREAAALQRDLTIVAPEPAARALAASAGLATHATVLEYESVAASVPRPGGIRDGGSARAIGIAPHGASAGPGTGTPSPTVNAAGHYPVPSAISTDTIPGSEGLRGPGSAGRLPVVGPPRRGPVRRPAVIAALFVIALVAAVGGVAAFVLLPSAEISLLPAREVVGPLALTITADPDATAPDATRLIVPASRVSLPVGVTAQFPATGKEVIEAKATGSVTFQNCDTGGQQTVPAASIVKTADGIAFLTNASLKLDRAKIKPAFACSAGNVAITAIKVGPEANVVAGRITQLPAGFDPVVLSVRNDAATTGGSRTELIRIVKADVDGALAVLRTRLNEAFAAKLAEPGIGPPGSVLMTQTQRLGEPTPSADPNALVGLQQAMFELGLTATGTAIAVDPSPVAGLAEARLASSVPAGYSLIKDSIRSTVDPPAASGESVTFAVRVRGERIRQLDGTILAAQVRGKSIAAARTILEPYGEVRIAVWPDWVTSIPDAEARVKLIVAAIPGSSPAPSPTASAPPTLGPAPSVAPTPQSAASATPARTVTPAPTAAATKLP